MFASQVATVTLGFLLTGLIGNRLLHAWQRRAWVDQQRHLSLEKEYEALLSLADELTTLAARRRFSMQQVSLALSRPADADLESCLADYRSILRVWNERVGSFNVRLTLLVDRYASLDFEKNIHDYFVQIGRSLELAARARKQGKAPNATSLYEVKRNLDHIQARIYRFNVRLLRHLEQRRAISFQGIRIPYDQWHMKYFSTWELIKSLFVRDVDSYAIFRPTADAILPNTGG